MDYILVEHRLLNLGIDNITTFSTYTIEHCSEVHNKHESFM